MTLSYGGKTPAIDGTCFQAPDSLVIGDVTIGAESSVWFKVVIRGDINYVRIGGWTNIQDGCIVHVTGGTSPTEIGDFVTVGHGAILHGCKVGSGCLIGMGAIVLDDTEIGDGSLVAAGTVVKAGMKIPSGTMVAGNPAVIKREISEKEARGFLDWAKQYREYARGYSG
jgi:carbonic anhydrase/acetyltransferase-like protein (isoleucine patch superfamily)